MANVGSMIDRVRRLCGNHNLATGDLVLSFINDRHGNLLESFDWSRRKQKIGITARVDKSDGTLIVTNGSVSVAGIGTTFDQSHVDWTIKIGADNDSLYTIRTVISSNQITLGDLSGNPLLWPQPSASGVSYVAFKQYYSLGAGVEDIISIKGDVPLKEMSEEWLDDMDPSRDCTASAPTRFCRTARDMRGSSDIVRIELYPRATSPQIITANILRGHVNMTKAQYPIVPSGPLQWYAAQDMCYKLFADTKDQNWMVLAQEYSKQAEMTLEREKNQDYQKFGTDSFVKDVYGDIGMAETDFSITHDLGD